MVVAATMFAAKQYRMAVVGIDCPYETCLMVFVRVQGVYSTDLILLHTSILNLRKERKRSPFRAGVVPV